MGSILAGIVSGTFSGLAQMGVSALTDKLKGPRDDPRAKLAAAEEIERRFLEKAVALGGEDWDEPAENTPEPTPAMNGPAALSTMPTCPSCRLFDEAALSLSYAQRTAAHCADPSAQAPGTVVQVREHIQAAIAASAQVAQERPALTAPARLIGQGFETLLAQIAGKTVACAQVQAVLPTLEDAVRAADLVAQAWYAKPGVASDTGPQPG